MCDMSSDFTFGHHSHLQYLLMSECNLKSFEVNIPQPLKESRLGSNYSTEAYTLVIENSIKKVKVKFAPNALEILDLSESRIKEFKPKFLIGDTNLKQLF